MFSIASSPTSKAVEIATRRGPSRFKKRLAQLRPGDTIALQPADGTFILDARHPAVFLTGGIGITPVKAMLEYATDKGLHQSLTLVYGNASQEDIVFREELDELAKVNPRIRIEYVLTDPSQGEAGAARTGPIDADLVRDFVPALEAPVFYISGPPSMVHGLRDVLINDLKIGRDRIKTEDFIGYR